MNADHSTPPVRLGLVLAAFAAIYVIWGSTYLAIRYAVETIPPFLMAGSRFLLAGLLLFGWTRWKGAGWPEARQWRDAAIVGTLMLLGGNGGVTWAEKTIPSSVAALIVAMVPLWMVLLEWREPGGRMPTGRVFLGLLTGFLGVGVLVYNGRGHGNEELNLLGVAALIFATITWAFGSLFSRRAAKPKSAIMTIGMQMITGGAVMMLVGFGFGEAAQFDWAAVSARSGWSWIYLTLMGSMIGFTAYVWLLQVSTPSKVSTYAFVNPLIAVLLGCTLGREPFSTKLIFSTGLILIAVLLIVRGGRRAAPAYPTPAMLKPGTRTT